MHTIIHAAPFVGMPTAGLCATQQHTSEPAAAPFVHSAVQTVSGGLYCCPIDVRQAQSFDVAISAGLPMAYMGSCFADLGTLPSNWQASNVRVLEQR